MLLLRVGFLGGSENISVEIADDILESAKLDHCVWNLSHPERSDTLVETVPALVSLNGGDTFDEVVGEGVRCLHSNFNLTA